MDLLPLALTLGVYAAATRLRAVPPTVTTAVVIVALLPVLGIGRERYLAGTAPLIWLLGPAVVALALPLVRERALLGRAALPLGAGIVAGAVAALVAALALGRAFGLAPALTAALAPRAATAPVAAALAARLGGDPQLAAAASVIGALIVVLGAVPLLRYAGALPGGAALGVSAHGIGVARALRLDGRAGAFASAAMALNAIVTALLAPAAGALLLR